MTGALKLLGLSLAALAAAFVAEHLFVPNVAPIAWSHAEPLWRVETAFLLRATQYAAEMAIAAIVLSCAMHTFDARLCPVRGKARRK
jgi:hypothetical protein